MHMHTHKKRLETEWSCGVFVFEVLFFSTATCYLLSCFVSFDEAFSNYSIILSF